MSRSDRDLGITRRRFLTTAAYTALATTGCVQTASTGEPLPSSGAREAGSDPAMPTPPPRHVDLGGKPRVQAAVRFLLGEMDRWTDGTVVYDDVDSGGAAFFPSSRMGDVDGLVVDPACVEALGNDDHSIGLTCIKITYAPTSRTDERWAGVYWTYPDRRNGNWGREPGRALTGATKLQGWIRGACGHEVVELKIGGINRSPHHDPAIPHQDDFGPAGIEKVLGKTWEQFEIRVPLGATVNSVIGGFACAVTAAANPHGCAFYLDDVHYDDSRPNSLRLIRSYTPTAPGKKTRNEEMQERVIRNAAHLYDNALALLVFLSLGDEQRHRAEILADSIVWAQLNDRAYQDGRWRNAYSCGPLKDPASGTARLPGWYDPVEQRWIEDRFAVSSDTGNNAWAMIALLAAHAVLTPGQKDSPYVRAALRAGTWIAKNCVRNDWRGGYCGGFEGWERTATNRNEPVQVPWSSTEHNLDLCVAFSQLAALTGDAVWRDRALHARQFVLSMWNEKFGHFWTGTKDPQQEELNTDVVPADAQTWAVLAVGHDDEFRKTIGWDPYDSRVPSCIDWVETNCRVRSVAACPGVAGYRFSKQGTGVWFEGAAHLAATYHYLGHAKRARAILAEVAGVNPNTSKGGGGMYAACPDFAKTGFMKEFAPGVVDDWAYPRRLHVGATAWFLLASLGVNPYWSTGLPAAAKR